MMKIQSLLQTGTESSTDAQRRQPQSSFLVSSSHPDFNHGVFSHELCHILLDGNGGDRYNHFSEPLNLMKIDVIYPDGKDYKGNFYDDTKRLTLDQEVNIMKSEYVK